jgi:hypothetical protein
MTSHRTWTLVVIAAVAVLVALVVSINLVVDAYGIVRRDFTRQFQEVNLNYVKMDFLLHHPDRFDSFIVGSSRAEKIDPRLITTGRFYDLTYPLGVPEEHLNNLRLLLARGVRIRNVMIGLDDFSSRVGITDRVSNLQLQPHPAISGKKPVTFYGEYFCKLKQFFPQLKEYIRYNYTQKNRPGRSQLVYDLFETGRVLCANCDEEIEKDVNKHAASARFDRLVIETEGDNREHVMRVMQELVDLARAHDIRLTVFVNPVHKKAYLETDLRQFMEFKRGLAGMTEYYDFSGLNSITTNNYYYYETSHYRPMVGAMMLKVMLGATSVAVPKGFGVLVTRANVDSHLRSQCRELGAIRGSYDLSVENDRFAANCEAELFRERTVER